MYPCSLHLEVYACSNGDNYLSNNWHEFAVACTNSQFLRIPLPCIFGGKLIKVAIYQVKTTIWNDIQ